MFDELIKDDFYKAYRKYDRCVLDYCILKTPYYDGLKTHKNAILFFMEKLKDYCFYPEKMEATPINSNDFFRIPNDYQKEKAQIVTVDYHRPYWFLFLNPPYETNYTIDDFVNVNNILFPCGKDNLDIYDWNVDWSNYFEEGLEWWGARCTSIYDKTLKRFVIILASATD